MTLHVRHVRASRPLVLMMAEAVRVWLSAVALVARLLPGAPLALAVLGGLRLSTPITLLLVPGLYAAIRQQSR